MDGVQERQGTTARILEAAIAQVDDGGEAGLRIDHIVTSAKVSAASIYQRFGSRDGLVQAVQYERYMRSMTERFAEFIDATAACQTEQEFRTLVESFLHWIIDPSRYPSRFTRANVIGSSQARPDLQQTVASGARDASRWLTAAIADAQQRGLCSKRHSPEAIVWWYSGSLLGRVEFELVQPEGLLEEYNAIYIEQLLHLLFD